MGPRKAEILPPGPAVHARHDHAPLNWMASAKDNNGSWPSRIFGFRWTTGRAGNTLTSTPCPAGMLVSGRSETTRGFNQRWRSVATRSQTLGPDGPREWWLIAYFAGIHQSEPESVKCVTLIGAMENTCGGGRGRRGILSLSSDGSDLPL